MARSAQHGGGSCSCGSGRSQLGIFAQNDPEHRRAGSAKYAAGTSLLHVARPTSKSGGCGLLQKAGGPDFVDFMVDFVRANGVSRRKYSPRGSFDFARHEAARRVQSSLKLGYKAGPVLS